MARAEDLARRRLSSNVETSYAAIVLLFFYLWCDIQSRKINRLINMLVEKIPNASCVTDSYIGSW